MLVSQLCTAESLRSPALRAWADRLRPLWDPEGTDPKEMIVHRKMWEWLFICEALSERGMLRRRRRGIGFGVGTEPLVAMFAARGCRLLATDLRPDQAKDGGWIGPGNQYSGGLAGLNSAELCDSTTFSRQVAYRYVDMNDLPDDLGTFDFSWSSCALEHLGTLDAGLLFLERQMDYLRPGGVAVHTTEFNLSSDIDTVETGVTVLYRRHDLTALAERLRTAGYRITIDFTEGNDPIDHHIDVPPFTETHLRTMLDSYVITSVALVIEKPGRTRRFVGRQ